MDMNQIQPEPLNEIHDPVEMQVAIVELDNTARDVRSKVHEVIQNTVFISLDIDFDECRASIHLRNDIRESDEVAAYTQANEFFDMLVVPAEEALEIDIATVVLDRLIQLAEVRECSDGFPPEMLQADRRIIRNDRAAASRGEVHLEIPVVVYA